jgi:hypothetical protein
LFETLFDNILNKGGHGGGKGKGKGKGGGPFIPGTGADGKNNQQIVESQLVNLKRKRTRN